VRRARDTGTPRVRSARGRDRPPARRERAAGPARAALPLKTVLVATDFSAGAERALERALLLPLAAGAKVHVVHVLGKGGPRAARTDARERALSMLEGSVASARDRAQARGDDLELTSHFREGQPFVEIIRSARELGAELVLVGRHGRERLRDAVIGTTAERVLRKGDVPVLVVNAEPAGPYAKPLVATDLSDASRRTFDFALRVLDPQLRSIGVVHAVEVPFEGFLTPSVSGPNDRRAYRRTFERQGARALEAYLEPYAQSGVTWRTVVRAGDPRGAVVATSLRRRADLLAIGTHGRTGIAHALLGSVAEWLVAHCRCDVLVVRPARFSFEMP
jgi:nucleotide-binding universal stress UspA family protein